MKKRKIMLFIFILGITGIILAANNLQEKKLFIGKNNITTSEDFEPIYAQNFIKMYPQIQTITFKENGKNKAYINYLGGIGNNFILKPNKTYEIVSSENISLGII